MAQALLGPSLLSTIHHTVLCKLVAVADPGFDEGGF